MPSVRSIPLGKVEFIRAIQCPCTNVSTIIFFFVILLKLAEKILMSESLPVFCQKTASCDITGKFMTLMAQPDWH